MSLSELLDPAKYEANQVLSWTFWLFLKPVCWIFSLNSCSAELGAHPVVRKYLYCLVSSGQESEYTVAKLSAGWHPAPALWLLCKEAV